MQEEMATAEPKIVTIPQGQGAESSTPPVTPTPAQGQSAAPEPTPAPVPESPLPGDIPEVAKPQPDAQDALARMAEAQAKSLERIRELETAQRGLIDPQRLTAEAQADPAGFLRQLGVDVSTPGVLGQLLGGEAEQEEIPSWARSQSDALQQLAARLDASDKARAEQQEAVRAQEAISAVHAQLGNAAESYPLISAEPKGKQAVTDYMIQYFRQHNQPIPWADAAKHVEQSLRESWKRRNEHPAYRALAGSQQVPAATTPSAGAFGGTTSAPSAGGPDYGPEDEAERAAWSARALGL